MCGVNLPEGSAPDSENHLDSWLKADVKGRSWAVEQNLHNNLSITDGVWKYIPAANGPAVNKQTNTELGIIQRLISYIICYPIRESILM